ncbi:MAG: aldehyde dehydrogenase family protein [Nevskiaceae bacterium]|nr:MAG: aldehyde dehydrogenase family protein [Nevskiaceae bacterium]TAM23794.1 MAG: aldehyde dehydrogenase family protein [Nevskiaceae bacterium]
MTAAVLTMPETTTLDAEVRRVFEKQFETAIRLRRSSADERIAKIKKLKLAVLAHSEALQQAMYKDFKKPAVEVDLTEILPVVAEAHDAIRKLKKWMKPTSVWPTLLTGGLKGYIQYEPRGRCLIIAPWNYPVNLCFVPLVSAIAAGNTAIIKPSEMTPHTTAVLVKIIKETFAEDEIAIFEGDASTSTALLALPFDHIFFTGSPAVGKIVMAAAAKHLTSVTLELGGKSPTIIDETADLDLAAQNILWGKYTNGGQTCIAPDHIFVHESVKAAFMEKASAVLKKSYGNSDADQASSPYLTHVVNQRHTQRVAGLLEDAKSRGATVVAGGGVNVADQWVAPTLITNIPKDAKIMSEEIFGPLLPIIGYTQLQSVVDEINANPKPLALYVWSRNEANIQKVMKETSSGGACINHTVVHYLHGNLPFGGVNNSGIGNAHGIYGFKAFSHERAVIRTRFMMAKMFFPPYSGFMKKMVRLLMKFV